MSIPDKVKRKLYTEYGRMLEEVGEDEIYSSWIVAVYDMPPHSLSEKDLNDECIAITLCAAKAMGAVWPRKEPNRKENFGDIELWEARCPYRRYHFIGATDNMMAILWKELRPIGHMVSTDRYKLDLDRLVDIYCS